MKKAGLILIFVSALFLNGYSQNVDDALRYSQLFYGGSARFMGMGGAFTALGGDLSAISLNPASTGVFRSFELSISPQMYNFNNTAKWNGTSSSDFKYAFNLSHIGFVANLVPKNDNMSLNFAYSFNKTNNFNENITITGISDNSSMADYWASQANGTYYKDLRGASGIAYDAWLIDTVSNSGASSYATTFSAYGTNTKSTYGQTIKRIINNEGFTGEHSLSIGGSLSNKLFFGVTLGISQLRYTGHYQHVEADYANVISDFKNFVYTDHFEASGTGYSGQIGLIYKPLDFLRLGAALHTPIFYRVSENFYNNITSAFDNNDTFEFSNDKLSYRYSFTTPMRYNLGAAFQIKKFALLSVDYEHLNYSKTRFSNASDSYDYSNENQDIQNILKAANNVRVGAEFRIVDKYYVRTGYSYYGKAFKVSEVNKDLFYQGLSFGLGLRQQNFYVDLAYSALFGSSKYYMYNDPPYLAPATLNSSKNSFTITMGVKF